MSGASKQCANRSLEDLDKLIAALDTMKKGGVRIPPALENSLRLAKAHYDGTSKGIESACEDVAAWVQSNEEYCATQSGFPNAAAMNAGGGTADAVDNYYNCLAQKQRAWQAKNVEAVLSAKNPKSFIAVYVGEVKKIIQDVIFRNLKDKAKKFVKDLGSPPSYERGPTP